VPHLTLGLVVDCFPDLFQQLDTALPAIAGQKRCRVAAETPGPLEGCEDSQCFAVGIVPGRALVHSIMTALADVACNTANPWVYRCDELQRTHKEHQHQRPSITRRRDNA
jgi:hypothetical protein